MPTDGDDDEGLSNFQIMVLVLGGATVFVGFGLCGYMVKRSKDGYPTPFDGDNKNANRVVPVRMKQDGEHIELPSQVVNESD